MHLAKSCCVFNHENECLENSYGIATMYLSYEVETIFQENTCE